VGWRPWRKVGAAFREGEISLPAVKVLAHTRESAPEAFEAAEELLVHAAKIHPVAELHRVVSTWREQVLRGRSDLREGRRLHASLTLGGMVRIDGDLDPEAGETLLVALSAVIDAEVRSAEPETRTPAQRRADALEEICRSYLERSDRPLVARERPHLVVTVPYEALTTGGPGELERTGALSASAVRRLACDGAVSRVVLSPRSEPLDVGRKTSVVPAPLRRAVVLRDRTCTFPGCDRHHSWCDAHHVRHWADGGPTALRNLVLLCRRHHRAVHERRFTVVMDDHPVFRRSDGSVLEDRGPPSERFV
jgi:uncharacterized protein DUF222/HNH endonuclease